MNIAFDEIIRNGVIALPPHLRAQAEGRPAHVVIPDDAAPPPASGSGWNDIIEELMRRPLPPFTPLTRDEIYEGRQ